MSIGESKVTPRQRRAMLAEAARRIYPDVATAEWTEVKLPPIPCTGARQAADAADQEAPAGRAPRRKRTGDPRADRKATAA